MGKKAAVPRTLTVSPERLSRLEAIINRTSGSYPSPTQKFLFYLRAGGNERKKIDEYGNRMLVGMSSGDGTTGHSLDKLLMKYIRGQPVKDKDVEGNDIYYELSRLQRFKVEPNTKEIVLQSILKRANERGDYNQMLEAARLLNLPAKSVRQLEIDMLEKKIYCGYSDIGYLLRRGTPEESYMGSINEVAKNLPKTLVRSIADKAYNDIIEGNVVKDDSHYARAAMLATEFSLGRRKVISAAEGLLGKIAKLGSLSHDGCGDKQSEAEKLRSIISFFRIPSKIARPLVVEYFVNSLEYDIVGKKIFGVRDAFRLSDSEIAEPLNGKYHKHISEGNFYEALRLRKWYPALIKDNEVTMRDLREINFVLHGTR